MAYLLIRNSDQSKYGSLLKGLISWQFSMNNNQYPKNIMNATDILGKHKHDRMGKQGYQETINQEEGTGIASRRTILMKVIHQQ